MKPSLRQQAKPSPSSRKFVTALAVASLISGLSVAPAFADEGHDHDRRGHEQRGHDHDRHDHDRHDYDRHDYGRRDYHGPYAYAQPVYVPPTVYVQPQQSPGVSLFLPLNFR